jgi:hypothetical protein
LAAVACKSGDFELPQFKHTDRHENDSVPQFAHCQLSSFGLVEAAITLSSLGICLETDTRGFTDGLLEPNEREHVSIALVLSINRFATLQREEIRKTKEDII